jgi:hypothetical protein
MVRKILQFFSLSKLIPAINLINSTAMCVFRNGVLSYFITLIPKVACPSAFGEFRPISHLGCLYKLIAKVLMVRRAKVMDSVLATTQ